MSSPNPPSILFTVHVPIVVGLVGLGALALSIDVQVARYLFENRPPGFIRKLVGMSEVFAHGYGTLIAVLAIYTLHPSRRGYLPRFAVACIAASVCAHIGKMSLVRLRPRNPELADFTGTWADTFGEWFPLLSYSAEFRSFPSAHVANGVGMMLALMWLYPRGKVLFPFLLVLAAAQRVQSAAHFVSDLFWGAAVGYVAAQFILSSKTNGWFERWEVGRAAEAS